MPTASRLARFNLEKLSADTSVLRVAIPGKISTKEFEIVQRAAIDQITKLTGHPCLSGKIKLIIEENYSNAARVDLKTGASVAD